MNTQTRWVLAPAVVLLGVGLAGCSGASTPTPTTHTHTVTAAASPSPSTSAPAAPAQSASPAPASSPATSTAPGGAAGASTTTCTTAHLRGSFANATAGASNVEEELHLTNTGSTACTLQGWPGVSLVGESNGTQIGKPAVFDRTTAHPTVTLQPGTTVSARFHYVQADAFDIASCKPATGDGFRVYPPGSRTSLFIAAAGIRGCTVGNETVFTVGAFH